ncbi:DUF6056 family protein [Streptomyces sp. NPDC126933]|uniref:DUF6056 family protein n=1 Tax=unclassified Streptomyces TaxID=2593676 RepID=UPI00364BDB69
MAAGASSVTIPRQPGERARPGGNGHRGSVRAWTAFWPVCLSLLPLGLLGMASWLGRHVRPSADEWCFLPSVRDTGISGLIEKFYYADNGRLGNGLLVGVYAKFGVAGHQWFGVISGVVMLGLLWAVTVRLLRMAGRTAPRGIPLLVASMMTAVFLFATPNTYKTFYWPASSVSHTAAPVLACAAAIPLLWARSRGGRIAALTAALVVGAFIGTLSEEASVVTLVVLSAVLLISRGIFTPRVRGFARAWCLTGVAGVGIGTLVLLTSPGSRNRRERYGAQTTSMFAPESLTASLRAFTDILESLLMTWQYAGAVAAGVLLGLLARSRAPRASLLLPCRPLFLAAVGALTFLAAGYLCTVITYPMFGSRVVTATRTWNDYLLLYVVLLMGAGALLGRALRRRGRRTGVATAAGAAACAIVCAGLVAPLGQLGDDMRVRAQKWDHQDQWLRARAADGARVLPYTPLSIRGMGEPFGANGRKPWPASCVASYYHLEQITFSRRLP